MRTKLDLSKVTNIKVAGIDKKDYPEFCNSYIEEACYNGIPMSESELDELNDKHPVFVYEEVIKSLF